MKAHLVAVESPISTWPEEIEAMCLAKVKNPRPVLNFDPSTGALESASTVLLCSKCLMLFAQRFDVSKRVYGVLPAEEAHRANLRNRSDD